MPLKGSVEILDLSFGPKMKDLIEYYWLLNEGVRVEFQCARCNFCEKPKKCLAFCQKLNNSNITENSVGLQGGAGGGRNEKHVQTVYQIQMLNRGTDCFVNATLQLRRNTEYATFLR